MSTPNHYTNSEHMRELEQTSLSGVLLDRECLAVGLSAFRESGQTLIAEDRNGAHLGFHKADTVLNSRPAPLTRNTHSTRLLLLSRDALVPYGRRFDQSNFAAEVAYAEDLGYPVVLKPSHGAQGHGIVTGIQNAEELEWALRDIASTTLATDNIILEEQTEDEAHGMIVVGDQVVSGLISRRGMD